MRLSIEEMQAPEFLKDRYAQFELLGAGGMGVVYRAFDQTLKKDVAIKILPGQKLTPERAMRFQQEARTASKLQHPNLITILDFGISPTGEPFLVMEFAAGDTLESIIEERGTIDAGSALQIVIQICEGMVHAHANGVVHRDLKPSNVIVEPAECCVKVVDFGIAKLTDEGKGLTLTPQGRLIGTPSYMSPEQMSGDEVDARSDIYSIGCILFHLLAGTPPFASDTSIEVLQNARTKRAPSIHEVNRSVSLPREVEELVAKALQKNRSQRQSSVEELQEELYGAMDVIDQLEKERTASDGNKGPGGAEFPMQPRPRRAKKSRRGMMIGALIGLGTVVPVGAIIYMIMASPAVPTSAITDSNNPGDALQLNPLVEIRPSQEAANKANKNKVSWKRHFESEWQEGTERVRALDSVTLDDLKQMADEKVKIFL
jgi:Serine/threonine protein kinase